MVLRVVHEKNHGPTTLRERLLSWSPAQDSRCKVHQRKARQLSQKGRERGMDAGKMEKLEAYASRGQDHECLDFMDDSNHNRSTVRCVGGGQEHVCCVACGDVGKAE